MIRFPAGRRIWAAFLANGFVRGARIAEQLLMVPLLLAMWGSEQFGEWTALSTIAMFVFLANLGVGNAALSDIVLRHAAGDIKGAARSFVTSVTLLTALIVAACLVLLFLLRSYDPAAIMSLHSIGSSEAKRVIFLLGLSTLLGFYTEPLTGVIGAESGLGTPYFLSGFFKVVELLVIAAAMMFAASPANVAAITLSVTAARILTTLLIAIKRARWSFCSLHEFEIGALARTWKASLAYFCTSVCVTFIYAQIPRLLVFQYFGAAALTGFAVIMAYTRAARMVGTMMSQAVQLEVGSAFGRNDISEFKRLVETAIGSAVGNTLILLVLEIALAPVLIPIWTRGQVAIEWDVLVALAAVALAGAHFDASLTCVAAVNRVGYLAVGYALSLAAGLLLGLAAMPWVGTVGVCISLILPELGGSLGAALTFRKLLPQVPIHTVLVPFRPWALFSGR